MRGSDISSYLYCMCTVASSARHEAIGILQLVAFYLESELSDCNDRLSTQIGEAIDANAHLVCQMYSCIYGCRLTDGNVQVSFTAGINYGKKYVDYETKVSIEPMRIKVSREK